MPTQSPESYRILLRLSRRALEGATPAELAEEARTELLPELGAEGSRALAEVIRRAAEDPDAPLELPADPCVSEAVELVRAATRRARASHTALERYHTIQQFSSDGIYFVDADGRYTEVNPRGCEMLGYSKDELLAMRIYDLVIPTDPPVDLPAVRAGDTIIRRRRLRRKDGSTLIAEIGARLLPDGGLLGIVRDVTEREGAERDIRERNERFRHALRAAGAGAWELHVDTGEAFWSEENYRLFGLEPRDGSTCYDAWIARVHPDDRERVSAAAERGLREGTDVDFEYRILRPDGTVRWLHAAGKARFGADGRPVVLFGIDIDVTAHKEAELARAQAEAQLHQAQRMEALGRLAGGIAHDFNNLLTVVLTSAEVLADALPPEGFAAEQLDAIRDAGTRGAALTGRLLALSRHKPCDPQRVDLAAHLRRIAPMLRRLLGEEIAIDLELASGLPPVRLDPGQLDQIVLNLAVNARDAMPRGGTLAFRTSLERQEGGAEEIELAVHDTGVGMDAQTRERIFEPFYSTKPDGSGTGLGLATVYGIVTQSGGRVDVESAPSIGTTFRIRIPAAPDAPAERPRPREAEAPAHTVAHVLVVEDERAVRRVVRRVLESEGHHVLEAADAEEALAIARARRDPLDLVLSDVVLPGLSGPELTVRLREERPELRVLLMSGYVGDALVRHGVARDVAVLEKPFTPAALRSAVRRALAS